MILATAGLYGLFWFYRNWSLQRAKDSTSLIPLWRAFFYFFYAFSLFRRIDLDLRTRQHPGVAPIASSLWLLALALITRMNLFHLPLPAVTALDALSMLILLPVQGRINQAREMSTDEPALNDKPTRSDLAWVVLGITIYGSTFLSG
jgi:hypothetical protein